MKRRNGNDANIKTAGAKVDKGELGFNSLKIK
jgi:hypothetical protein